MGTRRQMLVAVAGGVLSQRAGAATLKVFGDDHYAPLMYRTGQGQPAGLLVELLQRAEALTGDRYKLEMLSWKQAMTQAERGLGGLIGVSYNAARARWLDYSLPVYEDNIQVVVRRGEAFPFHGMQDLRGKTLGVGNAVSYGEEFERALAAGLFRVERDWGIDKRLRMLLAGRLDAAFIGSGTAGFEAALRRDPEVLARRAELEVLPVPAVRDPLHLAFPKSLRAMEALERFNRALPQLPGPLG